MCRKIKSVAVLLNLLHYFYHGIQCDKTPNLAHGEAFEVQHEIYQSVDIQGESKKVQ